jgi:hypothetical protein
MNSQRFCWWLKGAYNLIPDFDPLPHRETILKHLNMVFANQGEDNRADLPFHFCKYLEGVLRSEGNTTTIEEELADAYNDSEMSCAHSSSYAVDFCYWLQGAYELFPEFVLTKSPLNGSIQNLKDVIKDEHETFKSSPAYLFCVFLDGVVESEGNLGIVKDRLSQVFYHQIDKEYPNQQELSVIHNPSRAAKILDVEINGEKLREVVGGYKPRKFLDEDEDSLDNIVFQC